MKAELVGKGKRCPHCGKMMQRYSHPDGWKPKPAQRYFFRHWDRCACGHIQHYGHMIMGVQ